MSERFAVRNNRKPVSWAMALSVPVESRRQLEATPRKHVDQWGQPLGLKPAGLRRHMARPSTPAHRRVMERFFLSLKMERVWQKDYANHAEAIIDTADYIVNFYNAVRLHSTLGNLSPIAFEHQSTTKKTYRTVRNNLTTTPQWAFWCCCFLAYGQVDDKKR